MIRAVYPGTFDPITRGHLDVIIRSEQVFSEIIILVAYHNEKHPLFTVDERKQMIAESTRELKNVRTDSFDGLLVDYAVRNNIKVIIRGLRAISDFEYEFQMALMNRKISPSVETVFFVPHESYTYLSSGLIKQIIAVGGDVSAFVPPVVNKYLKEKFKQNG